MSKRYFLLGCDTNVLLLSAHNFDLYNFKADEDPFIIKLHARQNLPLPIKKQSGYIATSEEIPDGYSLYFTFDKQHTIKIARQNKRVVHLSREYEYLSNGDIVRLNPNKKTLRVLFRASSLSNSFLVTERCDNFCLMCSQPPRDVADDWIVEEIMSTIPLIDKSTREIGFTGGEPTLLGDQFLCILEMCKQYLPDTTVHILSNGRKFSDVNFAKKYAAINHPDMMVGIPVYSDVAHIHDYIVQAEYAFDETIRGILNLKKYRQQVEIRVVLHKQTYERLPHLAEFIMRNLAFVDHVALMGLELTGFTKANMDALWIDPLTYREELTKATEYLAQAGIRVSIYNHQLCVIDKSVWPYARKSISDWKNEYLPVCSKCNKIGECGGFFSSNLAKPSDHISPL